MSISLQLESYTLTPTVIQERFPRGTRLFAVASWYEQRLSVGNFDRPISHSVFGNIHPVFWRGARRGLESEPIEIPPTYFVKNLRDIRVCASPLDPSLHEVSVARLGEREL
jgi:hypothetical protein